MGVSYKLLKKLLPLLTERARSWGVMFRAPHGVGKSQLAHWYAKYLKYECVELRASQLTEGDVLGLPKIHEESEATDWMPPRWLHTACKEPCVLFLDEIDRATPEVRQAFFQLTDSRSINGHVLHPSTVILSAVNGGTHEQSSDYQVGEMDPAEIDRWTVFELEPTPEDWLNWGIEKDEDGVQNIHYLILDFIRQHPNHLEHDGSFEPNKVYPSRRSWHRLSDVLAKNDMLQASKRNPLSIPIATAFVGQEAAISFIDYVANCDKELEPEDIFDLGKIERTEEYEINQHLAFIEKVEAQKWFEKKWTKKQINNFAKYFVTLPSEIAMTAWIKTSAHHQSNALSLHKLQKPVNVTKFIINLMHGNQKDEEIEV